MSTLRGDAGLAIRERISELGLSQREVAAMVGCSEKHLSHLLNDKAGTTRFLDLLAHELGIEFVVRTQTRRSSE